MSKTRDYIIIISSDSDEEEVVTIEQAKTEYTEKTVCSDDEVPIQPNGQDGSDNYQPLSQMPNEDEGLAGVGDQRVLQMGCPAVLRSNPNSVGVEYAPLPPKGRSSVSMETNKARNSSEVFDKEKILNHLLKLKQCYKSLQELIKCTNKQVTQLYGVILKMQRAEEQSSVNKASPVVTTAGKHRPVNTPEVMGNQSMTKDTDLSPVCTSPNFDMARGDRIREENAQVITMAPVLENNNGGHVFPCAFIHHNPGSVKRETTGEENTQIMNMKQILESNNGGQDILGVIVRGNPGSVKRETTGEENIYIMNMQQVLESNNGVQDILGIIVRENPDSNTAMAPGTMIYPTVVENDKEQGANPESFFLSPHKAPLPLELLVEPDNSMGNNREIPVVSPIVAESFKRPDSSSSSGCSPLHMAYLGDPRRNVMIHEIHLLKAQMKPKPKHAARYLVRILFSRRVLLNSRASVNYYYLPTSCDRQLLDKNKMAALREFLAKTYPHHDLHEYGKDWRACISYINSLIRYLCSEATKRQQNAVTNKRVLARADSNNEKDADSGKGTSQLLRQSAASQIRANGNFQQNSSAVPAGSEEPSTSGSAEPHGPLAYIGHPSRNVQLSSSILDIARNQGCPELSARYLIRQLFSEEVLIRSNVYGNKRTGRCALNSNKINAVREFLQDVYPTYDLSEDGYKWKLCVAAVNTYNHALRHGYGHLIIESTLPTEMVVSMKLDSSDTDYSD